MQFSYCSSKKSAINFIYHKKKRSSVSWTPLLFSLFNSWTNTLNAIELSRIIRSVPSKPNTASLPSSLRFHIRYPTGLLPASPVLSDNSCTSLTFWISPRPISTYQLSTLLHLHLKPIYLVVFKGSYTCVGISHLEGGFTLRCLQRLSLPDLATLPWHWLPTGTPVVRPSRSSRTKDSSSQISYAHAG